MFLYCLFVCLFFGNGVLLGIYAEACEDQVFIIAVILRWSLSLSVCFPGAGIQGVYHHNQFKKTLEFGLTISRGGARL